MEIKVEEVLSNLKELKEGFEVEPSVDWWLNCIRGKRVLKTLTDTNGIVDQKKLNEELSKIGIRQDHELQENRIWYKKKNN
ncbi:MAG: hypothetical protein BAJALOKI3v1_640009 [Promethearchaeota archaeon]|jgi:hypothetical protein|nr:MAG: hypothetical protein BAJALOKI3v1_640009 [Candidatus Lokiarchaeota archaeon]